MNMKVQLMHKLLNVSDYIFQEMTDSMTGKDVGNAFWKFTKSKFLDDNTKKIKVSDYSREELFKIDVDVFNEKYSCKLQNVKKDKAQVSFVCSCVALMFQHSGVGESIIEWC